eukprot:4330272-Amphidinium_carterae.2
MEQPREGQRTGRHCALCVLQWGLLTRVTLHSTASRSLGVLCFATAILSLRQEWLNTANHEEGLAGLCLAQRLVQERSERQPNDWASCRSAQPTLSQCLMWVCVHWPVASLLRNGTHMHLTATSRRSQEHGLRQKAGSCIVSGFQWPSVIV